MNDMQKHQSFMVVDLTTDVLVSTSIPQENHAALRAGFVGYPANPRWNANKYRAWKTGREWREALTQGQMVVRATDSMLVDSQQQEEKVEKKSSNSSWLKIPQKAKQLVGRYSNPSKRSQKSKIFA